MSEDDETGVPAEPEPQRPEVIAVTPRGVVPGPAESTPEPAPAGPEVAVEPEAPDTLDVPPLPEATAEPETRAEPETPAEPETAAEPEARAEPEPAARTAAAGAEPEPQPVPDVEVSVRVAAEGMAAALAGEQAAGTAEGAPKRAVSRLGLATAVCVVLALAAATVLAITVRKDSRERAVDRARATTGTAADSALVAARAETAAALTYDYRTLDADFQRAEAGMSRKFRANYAQTAANSVAPLARRTHAVTTGTVAAAGVVTATPTTARILVFADQTVENKLLNATSRLDRSVIDVAMVKENGRWVIDDLQPF